MMTIDTAPRTDSSNPLAMDGLEFVEYATRNVEAFGKVLEQFGFYRIARHRSREIFLYRQGGMNVIINADPDTVPGINTNKEGVVLSGVAFRVANAGAAYHRMVDLGAWPISTRAGVMELNIPGVHGVSDSILYLVDRYRDFSIYDVDFIYDEGVERNPPPLAGMHFFGLVQYVGHDRMEEWIDFYDQLLGFQPLPPGESFGILPRGCLLKSPCGHFYLQLIAPPDNSSYDFEWDECFARLGFGVPDVRAAVAQLQARGVCFENREHIQVTDKGALTLPLLDDVRFELVASTPPRA